MTKLLDHLLDGIDPGILSQRDMVDLRQLRQEYQEIETGLSFGRRLVQGRLDIVLAEQDRRSGGPGERLGGPDEVLGRLPDVLAQHSRGGGSRRLIPDLELPDFIDVFTGELDHLISADELRRLPELDDARIDAAVDRLGELEQQLSRNRAELHRTIDEVQDEIVGRYRSGSASVDDLLT